MSEPVTLQWTDAEQLAPDVVEALMGPGAPYEFVVEDVLGEPLAVFAQRPRSMREVMLNAAERFGDDPYLVFPDATVTFAQLPGLVASYAAVLAEEHGVRKGDRVADRECQHVRVRDHRVGVPVFGRDHQRVERMVDRRRASVRRGAHEADRPVRRRRPTGAGPRIGCRARLSDGRMVGSSRRTLLPAPVPHCPTSTSTRTIRRSSSSRAGRPGAPRARCCRTAT